MKTPMQEWFDELKANYPYMANEIYQKGFEKYLEKENLQIKNLIRFLRTNDKMGKSVNNLYNEFYNQNK